MKFKIKLNLKKKCLFVITLILLLTSNINIFANTSLLSTSLYDKNLFASNYIGSYYSNFSSIEKGTLNISSMLSCGVKVDKLSISIILKEKIGGSWYQIATWSESAEDDYSIILNKTYSTAHSGSEYQIDVTYKAQKGSNIETRHVIRNTIA